MRIALAFVLFLALQSVGCLASDDTLSHGVPGTYLRHDLGLATEKLRLKADGTYTFDFIFDMGADREVGTWNVRDRTLILTRNEKRGFNRDMPSRFSITVVNRDLALKEVRKDEDSDDSDESRLFLADHEKANQSKDPAA